MQELGAELPRYELIGRGLRVHFKALESALIDPPKAPKRQNVGKDVGLDGGLAERIDSPKVPKCQIDTLNDTLDDTLVENFSKVVGR